MSKKVYEENEKNNEKTVTLGGTKLNLLKPKISMKSTLNSKPDLKIQSITLDQQNRIVVEVKNSANVGLDISHWAGSDQPYLNLKLNGNNWANVYLNGIDTDQKLAQPNGIVYYNTGYQIQKNTTVKAEIDAGNTITEVNENNNSLEVSLKP